MNQKENSFTTCLNYKELKTIEGGNITGSMGPSPSFMRNKNTYDFLRGFVYGLLGI